MRVLLATDGSDAARAATDWLLTFPLPTASAIRVLTVASLEHARPGILESAQALRQTLQERAGVIVGEARDALTRRWAEVESCVADGDAREEIIRMAEEWHADLVVLGARGLTPLKRALLGSVSTAVVRHAHCPVLVVRGRPQGLREIVVGVDGSPDSLGAVAFLGSLPLDPQAQLTLVGAVVVPPPLLASPEMGAGPLFLDETLARWEAEAERALETAAASFKGKVATIARRVLIGPAGEEIVGNAHAVGADLIVVGARGLGAFTRLLLGSVSEYVLLHAECPVLVVRGR